MDDAKLGADTDDGPTPATGPPICVDAGLCEVSEITRAPSVPLAAPDPDRLLRDRLAALGEPADDCPDDIVEAAVAVAEYRALLEAVQGRVERVSRQGGLFRLFGQAPRKATNE